jgi:hypothetical protein
MLAKARPGIRFNEHMEGDREIVFPHARKPASKALSHNPAWAILSLGTG